MAGYLAMQIISKRPSKLFLTIAFSLVALALIFQLDRLTPYYNVAAEQLLFLTPANPSDGAAEAPSKNYPAPTQELRNGLAGLPADYLVVEQDNKWCRENYGTSTLFILFQPVI